MTEVVYSTRKHPFAEGRKYQNPRVFSGLVEGATKVYIEGDYPAVEKAYAKAGVTVVKLDGTGVAKPKAEKKGPDVTAELAKRGVPADPTKAGAKG